LTNKVNTPISIQGQTNYFEKQFENDCDKSPVSEMKESREDIMKEEKNEGKEEMNQAYLHKLRAFSVNGPLDDESFAAEL